MSIQPSQNFNLNNNLNKWQKVLELADILSTQFSLQPLLAYVTHLFDHELNVEVKTWLEPSLSQLSPGEEILSGFGVTLEKTPLMDQAFAEKQVFHKLSTNPGDAQNLLAIPLMVGDQFLGVMQFGDNNQASNNPLDVEFCFTIASQFSIALQHLQNCSQREYLQKSGDHLKICEEISRSVLSNLDREGLLNNLLSLLHQKLNCGRVNIYMLRGEDDKLLKKIGISAEGIEAEKAYYLERKSGPLARSLSILEPEIINDIALYQSFSSADFEKNTQSELFVPLLFGKVFLGIIELCSDVENAFGPETLRGYDALAQNITLALRNANLYYSVQARRNVDDQLRQKIGVLSAEVSLDDLIQTLIGMLERCFAWDAAAIWLYDRANSGEGIAQSTSNLRLAGFRIREQLFSEESTSLPQNTQELFDKYLETTLGDEDIFSLYPWLSEILHSSAPVIRNSPFQYEPFGAILGFNSDYSAIGAQLIVNDQTFGAIVLTNHLPDEYDAEMIDLSSLFADRASTAIENVRLYAAAHDQAWIATVLLQVADATQSITNLDDLLETVVSMLPGLIGVNACTIFLWDASIEIFTPKTSQGFDDQQLARFDAWEITPGSVIAFDDLKESSRPVIFDRASLSDEVIAKVFPDYDFENNLMILFPLVSQTSLCGAILIDFSSSSLAKDSSQDVWDETYTLIEGTARQTAVAIENLQLIKSQEEEAYTSIALLQVAQAIVSFNKLDEILSSIVRITPILVGVKRCIIYLWDTKEIVFRQSEYFGFSRNELELLGEVIKANEFPFINAIQQANQILYQPLAVDNSPINWNEIEEGDFKVVASADNDTDEDISIKLDARSLITPQRLLFGFPLSVKGEVLGVMLIEEEEPISGTPSLHIRERRVEIVKGITQQAAIAIKNELLQQEAVKSERMERELQLAREIQTTFLPNQLPELPGWDIAVRWQPAREVGGDFYDILKLDDDRIGFVIADVADKGMPAAMFMTLVRTLIRAAAKEKSSPAAVLKQVNELMLPDSKHGLFVTVFYAVFSVSTGRLSYANAGHNPPLVKRANQPGLVELTRTTIALGIFDEIEVEEREIVLNTGDLLLLYTDGVTEAFSSGEEIFGTQRLFDLIENYRLISSDALLDKIVETVYEFIRGVDLSDDVTLAAIYRKPGD